MRHFAPLNWIQWVSLALAFTVAFTIPILYMRIQHVQHHQNDAIQAIICFAEKRARSSPVLTVKQKHDAIRFYQRAIADAHLQPCN